jgi:hypothetical protein
MLLRLGSSGVRDAHALLAQGSRGTTSATGSTLAGAPGFGRSRFNHLSEPSSLGPTVADRTPPSAKGVCRRRHVLRARPSSRSHHQQRRRFCRQISGTGTPDRANGYPELTYRQALHPD